MREELVKIETAKVAKEKGFDIPCMDFIDIYGEQSSIMHYIGDTFEDKLCSAKDQIEYFIPTQSLLQKWLREVHHIIITVDWKGFYGYFYKINFDSFYDATGNTFKVYEEALEAILHKALRLILTS